MKVEQVVRCEYDFDAEMDGELAVREGQVLAVLDRQSDPNWLLCCSDQHGARGRVPANYVTALDDEHQPGFRVIRECTLQ